MVGCADCQAMSAEVTHVNRGLLSIIALLFLGGSAKELFGGAARGLDPSVAASVLRRTAAGLAYRPGRASVLIGAAATVSLFLGLLAPTWGEQTTPIAQEGTGDALAEKNTNERSTDTLENVDDSSLSEPVDSSDTGEETDQAGTFSPGGPFPIDHIWEVPPAEVGDEQPVDLPVDPPLEPPVVPVNLVMNGGFDAPGYNVNDGNFLPGAAFEGWTLSYSGDSHTQVVRVWYPELNDPNIQRAAPFESGPWIRLVGNMTQTIPTEIGATYLIEYDTRATGTGLVPTSNGWGGGSPGNVLVDGVVVDQFVTAADPLYSPGSVTFTATSTSTDVSFVTTGFHGFQSSVAAGLDNISVTAVPHNDSPIMIPAIAGGIGVAALAAGSGLVISRKNKRASK